MAFVDIIQHADESATECRRRRRVELVRGWRFACGCSRCEEEGKAMTVEEKDAQASETEQKDESMVEASLSRYEGAEESDNIE